MTHDALETVTTYGRNMQVDKMKSTYSDNCVFGKILSSVLWDEASREEGEFLVHAEPATLVESVNESGFTFLFGHNPGRPRGRALAARVFTR